MWNPLETSYEITELLFAHRNKNYGAYKLRTTYGNTVLKSISLMALITGSIVWLCFSMVNKWTPDLIKPILPVIQEKIVEVIYNAEEKKALPLEKTQPGAPKSPGPTNSFSFLIKDTLETANDSSHYFIQQETISTSGSTGSTSLTGNPGSSGSGTTTGKSGVDSAGVSTRFPDELPEFEGGLAALYAFVSRNVRYPDEARDKERQGKVNVRFIVDETGRVILPKALNKLGCGLDEEATRVISILPKFKSPAKVDGEPVKAYFTLPINFRLY